MARAVLKLPEVADVARLMADTLGRDAYSSPGERFDISEAMSGFYMNEAGDEGIVCMADVPLVNYAGAALALIPVNMAEEGVSTNSLSNSVIENFFEILNIFGALLNKVCSKHVRLVDVKYPGDPLPAPVAAMIRDCEQRHDMHLHIEDYGSGSLSVLRLP